MEEAEIYRKISYYRQQIQVYDDEIRKLNLEAAKLYELSSDLMSVQSQFEFKLSQRRSRLSLLSACDINQKLVGNIHSRTSSFLYGYQCENAYSGIFTAQEEVRNKIDEIEQRIASVRSSILHCQEQISILGGQLARL